MGGDVGVGKEVIIGLAQLNCKCNCQLELSLAKCKLLASLDYGI